MREARERNFVSFQFTDNVSELADGLLPMLAKRAGMEFDGNLSAEQIGALVGIIGKNKGLRDNPDLDFLSLGEMATFARVAREERLDGEFQPPTPISRSLEDPAKTVPEGTSRVITGAVANWFDFQVDYLVEKSKGLTSDVSVHVVAGNREMQLPTELTNPNIQDFRDRHDDQLPTEYQYGQDYGIPRLEAAGYKVEPLEAPSDKGEEIANFFVAKKPELFSPDKQLSIVRTSISALQLALQMRKAARLSGPIPELFIEAAARKIASTKAEVDRPLLFQAPQPALRQVAVEGRLLLEEQQAETA